jgi:hypothetical protein
MYYDQLHTLIVQGGCSRVHCCVHMHKAIDSIVAATDDSTPRSEEVKASLYRDCCGILPVLAPVPETLGDVRRTADAFPEVFPTVSG